MITKYSLRVIICFLFPTLILSKDYPVAGELIFKLKDMPPHSIQFRIQSEDNVFDENKLYTTKYQGKIHTICSSATEINVDFCSDQNAGSIDTIGYSLYKITLGNSVLHMDYRDCNYNYPGINWDVTFKYYYSTGELLWWDSENEVYINYSGYTFPIWRTRPDWGIYTPNVSCFRPAVLLENRFMSQLFGRLEIDNFYYVESGNFERFDMATYHQVRPEFQRYLEGGGIPDKELQHHNWNEILGNYYILNDFYVNSWISEEKAWFDELKTCTLNTKLLSGGTGIKIGFKDPWLIESDGSQPGYFHSYPSPFIPSGGNGAFLNQDPNQTPIFYTVKVPQDTTIQFHSKDIDWYFLKWEGEDVDIQNPSQNQTNVVFRDNHPNVNSTVTAKYKGHLASSSDKATGYNNGRRLVSDYLGNWQMVYQDHNQVYYTTSTDNGITWTP